MTDQVIDMNVKLNAVLCPVVEMPGGSSMFYEMRRMDPDREVYLEMTEYAEQLEAKAREMREFAGRLGDKRHEPLSAFAMFRDLDGARVERIAEAAVQAVHGWACGCDKPWPTRGYEQMDRAVREAIAPLVGPDA